MEKLVGDGRGEPDGGALRTLAVHGEVKVANAAELAEDLVEVVLGNVLRQPLHDDLAGIRQLL